MTTMITMSLSAVRNSGTKILKGIFKEISKREQTNWAQNKEKFLTIDLDEKRKHYRMKEFVTLENVSTWPKYRERKGAALGKRLLPLKDVQIDASKNATLANKVSIFKGDITTLEIDAIVNAANKSLLGGGGVDGAIHKAAGSALKEECKTLNGCQEGEAKMTGGYKLPAKYVIHTVGPQGEKTAVLKNCYKSCLKLMLGNNLRSIAFPCVATGIYGYPNEAAAHVALTEVRKHLEDHADKVDRIIFCIFLEKDEDVYEGAMQSYFPPM